MIHPAHEQLNFEAMEKEVPQTEREWRIYFIGELSKLSSSIHELTMIVKEFKGTEIQEMRRDIAKLQKREMEIMASWKTIVVMITASATLLGLLIKALFK